MLIVYVRTYLLAQLTLKRICALSDSTNPKKPNNADNPNKPNNSTNLVTLIVHASRAVLQDLCASFFFQRKHLRYKTKPLMYYCVPDVEAFLNGKVNDEDEAWGLLEYDLFARCLMVGTLA